MMAPAPLISEEVNLAGHEWFPLWPERLRKSKWWRRASDLSRARNIMLWCEAWKSTPAGSLPDDDDELAECAGFGMDAAAFIALKAEIMAPWTLCNDGRWYHPTLCEQVLEAWGKLSDRRKEGRARQARHRERTRTGHEAKPDVTRDSRGCNASPAENDVSHGRRGEERRGEERKILSHRLRQSDRANPLPALTIRRRLKAFGPERVKRCAAGLTVGKRTAPGLPNWMVLAALIAFKPASTLTWRRMRIIPALAALRFTVG